MHATAAGDDHDPLSEGVQLGPHGYKTLEMLDWQRLCGFVANFASMSLGRQEILALKVSNRRPSYVSSTFECERVSILSQSFAQPCGSQREVERAQADTLAADLMEARYAANIDFGGISSSQACQPFL